MRHRLVAIASIIACTALGFGTAQAVTVAGWDFSQYRGSGSMTIDNSTFVNTLPANYSSRDLSFGAGSGAGSYGTLYMDGTAGSTSVSPGFGSGAIQPVAANVSANINGPATIQGASSFNTFPVLSAEGQLNTQYTALSGLSGSPSLVFEADLTPDFPGPGTGGTGWSVSFGGMSLEESSCDDGNPSTTTDCDALVSVEFELDGGGYSSAGSVVLTPEEQAFDVPLDFGSAKVARVRLSLDTTAGRPIIDNVSVNATYVPEPAAAMQLMAGLAGLLALARRRA